MTLDESWLLERVVVCPSGCYLWVGADSGARNGAETGRGYPKVRDPETGKTAYAHRVVFRIFKKKRIRRNQDVDHLCAAWTHDPWLVRRCVRPEHLEATGKLENQRRRDRRRRAARRKRDRQKESHDEGPIGASRGSDGSPPVIA